MPASKPTSRASSYIGFGGRSATSRFVYGKWLSLAFTVLFGGAGAYLLLASHADSVLAQCKPTATQSTTTQSTTLPYPKRYCTFAQTTPVYSGVDGNSQVGSLPPGLSWVLCQALGTTYPGPTVAKQSNAWAYTQANTGNWGWVNAYYTLETATNQGFRGVPICSPAFMTSERSYPPGYKP
ncbi:MAG TPA: hypothetical protein VLE99_02940 [Candidatus Saccharimonadales bacterium]|nr:hypothetical protein [Candidatus Saccharimonadales bacterium]